MGKTQKLNIKTLIIKSSWLHGATNLGLLFLKMAQSWYISKHRYIMYNVCCMKLHVFHVNFLRGISLWIHLVTRLMLLLQQQKKEAGVLRPREESSLHQPPPPQIYTIISPFVAQNVELHQDYYAGKPAVVALVLHHKKHARNDEGRFIKEKNCCCCSFLDWGGAALREGCQ